MTRARGFTLIEIIATLPLMTVALFVLAVVSRSLIVDMPRRGKTASTSSGISHLVRTLREDVEAGTALPDACGGQVADENTLLIRTGDGTVSYSVEPGCIRRCELAGPETEVERTTEKWQLQSALVTFERYRVHGEPRGVVLHTAVEEIVEQRPMTKLANAHLLFLGASGGGGRP